MNWYISCPDTSVQFVLSNTHLLMSISRSSVACNALIGDVMYMPHPCAISMNNVHVHVCYTHVFPCIYIYIHPSLHMMLLAYLQVGREERQPTQAK